LMIESLATKMIEEHPESLIEIVEILVDLMIESLAIKMIEDLPMTVELLADLMIRKDLVTKMIEELRVLLMINHGVAQVGLSPMGMIGLNPQCKEGAKKRTSCVRTSLKGLRTAWGFDLQINQSLHR
jgi:hypothetical protein